jgi:hypothetical protein
LFEGVEELFVPHIVNGKGLFTISTVFASFSKKIINKHIHIAAKVTGNYFYVFVENQRASFDASFDVHKPATPVCDRSVRRCIRSRLSAEKHTSFVVW